MTIMHERLSARLRHFSFGAAVVFVVAAAGIVIHSLYNIQIKNGATFRQYAAQQQLWVLTSCNAAGSAVLVTSPVSSFLLLVNRAVL